MSVNLGLDVSPLPIQIKVATGLSSQPIFSYTNVQYLLFNYFMIISSFS
jgi:hypothetical protein